MYWDKVIIAALLTASPSFGQRLGGLDHFEVVGVGRLFDGDAVKGDWMPTRRNLDEVAGVEEQSQLGELEDQSDIEEEKVVGEEEFFIIDEGAEVEDFEYDSVSNYRCKAVHLTCHHAQSNKSSSPFHALWGLCPPHATVPECRQEWLF